ncbi:hypothetical protein RSOLAG22IIIB_07691 [Rhizoctonia solani]|uniref:Uncharacterized protein n=1 Tax=Rhizoctonia solani TaxID=456999 RepID=A0A0K6FPJ5_9AGAM|nr:hypothetical protein RSOLAG22IIIB_07691 [Rhizoctonia solani]
MESNTWSYGQITALSAAMLQAIISLCRFVFKWRNGRVAGRGSRGTNKTIGNNHTSDIHADLKAHATESELTFDVEKKGGKTAIEWGEEKGNELNLSIPRRANLTENMHISIFLVEHLTRVCQGASPFLKLPSLPFTVDSPSLLRELLPNLRVEDEQERSLDCKAAAQSPITLFKSSQQAVKRAHDAGYAACLQDMLKLIQSGVSEDADVGVARVMDWAEGQLDRYRRGQELEKVEEATAALPQREVVVA